jgi:hypothetical protein
MATDAGGNLLAILAERFARNRARHPGLDWASVAERLARRPEVLRTLGWMEATGGEPDVVEGLPGADLAEGAILFCDCAAESPAGRRSLCYDDGALTARKENKPKGSAVGMAAGQGLTLLSETDYRALQTLGPFDCKTSSWIATPDRIRSLGGALFCDRRYDTVFTYHNGAESYYAARGFRTRLAV